MEQQKPTAYLDYRLFVPQSAVTKDMLDAFEDIIPDFFDEIDENGDQRENRDLKLQHYKIHPEGWVSFSRGDLGKIRDYLLPFFNIEDVRAHRPLANELKWLGVKADNGEMVELRENQVDTIRTTLAHGYGQLQAPPRYGKTVCMTNIITQVQQKTIVFAHQVELLQQFEEKLRACTNIDELERKAGRRLAGLCLKEEHFDQYIVCCATWQGFLPGNSNHKLMEKLKDSFGCVLVDEAHRAASECFSKVIAKFNPRYRFGFTATPERKDGLEAVVQNILGPVVAAGDVKQIPMRIRPVYTGFKPVFTRWYAYERQIRDAGPRNRLILEGVAADVQAGHSVLVVCTRVEHITNLVDALNRKYNIPAEGWYSSVKDRQGVLGRAKTGATKVIVAMRSMLLGLNVPRWSSIHITVPSNNPHNFYQEFARVRTPNEGKPFCVIRDYVDNHKAAVSCFKTRYGVYTNPMHAPAYFEDKYGNLLNKAPTMKAVEEMAMRDEDTIKLEDLPVNERKPKTIFQNRVRPLQQEEEDAGPLGMSKAHKIAARKLALGAEL